MYFERYYGRKVPHANKNSMALESSCDRQNGVEINRIFSSRFQRIEGERVALLTIGTKLAQSSQHGIGGVRGDAAVVVARGHEHVAVVAPVRGP